MCAVTAGHSTAAGTAEIQVYDFTEHCCCSTRLLTDDGQQFFSDLSDELHALLGISRIATGAHHPNGNGGTGMGENKARL